MNISAPFRFTMRTKLVQPSTKTSTQTNSDKKAVSAIAKKLQAINKRKAISEKRTYQTINDYLQKAENITIKPYQYQLETSLKSIDVVLDMLKFVIPIMIGAMATVTSLYPKNSIIIFGWILGGSFCLLLGMISIRFYIVNRYVKLHKSFYEQLNKHYMKNRLEEFHALFREKDEIIKELDTLIKHVDTVKKRL